VPTPQRQLMILRHAKSAWPDGVPDRKRPLAKRGRRDAPAAGRWLRHHVVRLDAVVCSPAERARQTWALAAAELDQPPAAKFDDRIYRAPPAVLLTVVRELPTSAETALLVGHNPGVQVVRRPALGTGAGDEDLVGRCARLDGQLGRRRRGCRAPAAARDSPRVTPTAAAATCRARLCVPETAQGPATCCRLSLVCRWLAFRWPRWLRLTHRSERCGAGASSGMAQ